MSEKKIDKRKETKLTEKELYKIVYHFRENVKPQGNIKYRELYEYHLELHKTHPEICRDVYSYDFWRKKDSPGRKVIDNVNEIRKVTLVDSNNNKRVIPNVVDVVNKYLKDPDRLMKHLAPLENEARRSIESEIELKRKNDELKKQLEDEKEQKRILREQIELLKECIMKLFHYSVPDGTPLENLLDMNNRNKRIKKALNEAWLSPQEFFKEFEQFEPRNKNTEVINEQNNNVVSITNAKKTIADEFKGRF